MTTDEGARAPGIGDAFRTWARVGLLSFGGPAGQIALMHRIIVEEKRWVSETQFLHALNYCMLLPGPEAQQLATYLGWLLHRIRGGLMAGILFVLPGFLAILTLSVLYVEFRDSVLVAGLFYGLKPAVIAIVVHAVVRIGGRTITNGVLLAIAAAAFTGIFFLQIPFPLIVAGAGLAGYIGSRIRPGLFVTPLPHAAASENSNGSAAAATPTWTGTATPSWTGTATPSLAGTVRVVAVCLAVWFVPVALLAATTGTGSYWVQASLFFSKAAVVTFGGAYAVLAYIAQRAVETYGWLAPGEMLDGLGMAETTPGPLIQVVQFVGFMGAYRNAGILDPLVAGVLGSILITWVTFVPCFLFIFAGAPWIQQLRGRTSLHAALTGITAAVVGVILNLALWFSMHVLFADVHEVRRAGVRFLIPDPSTVAAGALPIAAGAFIMLVVLKRGIIETLLAAAVAGLVLHTM